MFILRRISPEGVEQNIVLGNEYTHVDRFSSYEEFCKWFPQVFNRHHVADLDNTSSDDTKRCCGFVIGNSVYPIYFNEQVYVMTETGRTFTRVYTYESKAPVSLV